MLFVHLPKTIGSFTVSSTSRPVPVRPPLRRVHFSVPAVVATNNLAVAASAHHSFIKKRRKRSPFDADFVRSLEMMADGERIVDEFYSFWELLNDMARVGEKRLTTALTAQLTTTFWHPVICTALSSTYPELAIATTKYTTEMIKSLTDQMLLQSFLVILIGERGGVGKDLEPEVRQIPTSEQEKEPVEEEEEEVETKEEAKEDQDEQIQSPKETGANQEEITLRRLLISRINQEPELLALCTLRLFDTILETYNQFAVYNLVLRNYLDITPDGKYVDETEEQNKSSSEALDGNEDKSVTSHDRGDDEASNADEEDTPVAQVTSKENQKDPKVRWLVERYVVVSFIAIYLLSRCYAISFNRFVLFKDIIAIAFRR